MKNACNALLSLLMAAFIAMVSGCASPTEEFGVTPRAQMTVAQARRALTQALHDTHYTFRPSSVRDIRIKRDQVTWVEVADGKTYPFGLTFADISNIKVIETSPYTEIHFSDPKALMGWNALGSRDKATAMKFVDAFLTLKAAASAPGFDAEDFATFTAQAEAWRATTPRPEMSDEARTYKLLAEDAFKRQDLAAALEAYENALELHPMWPQGHYNAALLAAETNDYSSAADHMRRYLVLAPDAKDARAAKDKLLLWQHKAKG